MQNKIHINIKICDRVYPIKADVNDESKIREAAKHINLEVTKYANKLNITDKQDLLAMVAFDCLINKETMLQSYSNETARELSEILDMIKSNL